jgi:hypothetical protein
MYDESTSKPFRKMLMKTPLLNGDKDSLVAPSELQVDLAEEKRRAWLARFGVVPLPRREGPRVTNEWVNRIRDDDPDGGF